MGAGEQLIIINNNNRKEKRMGKKYPGLEARLGGVVAAVGADGVDGVRIDLHLRIIVAAGQEPHLDCPQMQTQLVEEDARIK